MPFTLHRILVFVSLFPHDFATMCLTSCEFTGKAISQINGYKCSVWCVLDMLLTFHSPCQWESGLAEKWITQNGVLAFCSQEASYHNDSLDARFLFSSVSSLHPLYSGVTNNIGGTTRWTAAGKLWEGRKLLSRLTKQSRRDYEQRKQWFPFLLWVYLKQQSHRNQLLHTWLSWLQDTLPVESSLP